MSEMLASDLDVVQAVHEVLGEIVVAGADGVVVGRCPLCEYQTNPRPSEGGVAIDLTEHAVSDHAAQVRKRLRMVQRRKALGRA